MARKRTRIRRLEAAAILRLASVLRRASPRRRIAIGYFLGGVAHTLGRRRRDLARRNIREALGVGDADARRIARGAFRHFGRVFAECLAMPAYLGDDLEQAVRVEGLEHLARAHAKGRGVIVCSGHIGNWELAGLRQCHAGFPIDFISRPLANPFLYDQLLTWRAAGGIRTHDKHGAVRAAMKVLKEGRSLAFVVDQNMSAPPRVFVPFFGRAAATSVTLGHLALRLGTPVVPAYTIPAPDGTYVLRYLPEMSPPAEGGLDEKIRQMTLEATQLVESWIRSRPETWLWLHDRWKTRPGPGEAP